MKSPWHMGLMILAITGISAYDYYYFKGRGLPPAHELQQPKPIISTQKQSPSETSVLSPLPATGSDAAAFGGDISHPWISRDQIYKLARQAFVDDKPEKEGDKEWPHRDPFAFYAVPEPSRGRGITEKLPENSLPPAPQPPPLPQFVLSGTLIDPDHPVALIDGVPLSVGDRLGEWQITRIESDHVIIEAGDYTKRIGFH